jgi:hypothetical protein
VWSAVNRFIVHYMICKCTAANSQRSAPTYMTRRFSCVGRNYSGDSAVLTLTNQKGRRALPRSIEAVVVIAHGNKGRSGGLDAMGRLPSDYAEVGNRERATVPDWCVRGRGS